MFINKKFMNGHVGITALALVLTLTLTSCGSRYKYETVKGDQTKTRIYTLKNGLKVYLSVNKEEPRIQTYIAVRTGSKNDPAETTGLAHYLEHLMFKGTDKFGVTDPEKEAPLLDQIEQQYEHYRTLTDPEVQAFLSSYGYESCSCCEGCDKSDCGIQSCLEHLMSRLAGDGQSGMRFPHEIGIFLGYPLQDGDILPPLSLC